MIFIIHLLLKIMLFLNALVTEKVQIKLKGLTGEEPLRLRLIIQKKKNRGKEKRTSRAYMHELITIC